MCITNLTEVTGCTTVKGSSRLSGAVQDKVDLLQLEAQALATERGVLAGELDREESPLSLKEAAVGGTPLPLPRLPRVGQCCFRLLLSSCLTFVRARAE